MKQSNIKGMFRKAVNGSKKIVERLRSDKTGKRILLFRQQQFMTLTQVELFLLFIPRTLLILYISALYYRKYFRVLSVTT